MCSSDLCAGMATAFSSLRARLFALLLLALLLLLAPLAWLSAREAERAASEDLRRALYTRLYLLQAEGVQDEERLLLELFRLAQLFEHERFWSGVVALTADHGETLRTGGVHRYGHHTLSHANLAIPLVLVGPGVEAGARIETPVEQLDVGRTLLDLAGHPDADFPGRNLLAGADASPGADLRFALEANGYSAAVLRGRWMLKLGLREDRSVLEKTGDWYHKAELYDITVDESCEHDLGSEHPELFAELRRELVDWLRSRSSRGWSEEARGDAGAIARQLAELGYTGSDPASGEREWIPVGCPCPNCSAAR